MKRILPCLAALFACACNDFDAALTECRTTHHCEDSTRPPKLVQHSPAADATDLPIQMRVSVTFDEPMTRSTVRVQLSPAYELGEPAWSENDTRVSFPAPPADLDFGREYTVTVEGSDLGGAPLTGIATFRFRTRAAPDTTAPTITGTQPTDNATNHPHTGDLSIFFSEGMQPDASSTLLSLSPTAGCTYEWQSSNTALVCHMVSPLQYSTQYTVTVTSAVKDVAGNAVQPYTFRFTTAAAPDTTPPTIVSTSPVPDATGVDKLTPITITFSEPMQRATVEAAFQLDSPLDASGLFSWNPGSTAVTIRPLQPQRWPWGGIVRWQLGTGAKDAAGNALASLYEGSFTVEQLQTLTLTSVASLDGWVRNRGGGAVEASTTTNEFLVGDDQPNDSFRGFVSFDVSSLPVDTIEEAKLYLMEVFTSGNPSALGPLSLDSVNYGTSLTTSDWDTPVLLRSCLPPCLSALTFQFFAPSSGFQYSLDVTEPVQFDVTDKAARGSRSQFRIYRNGLTDSDNLADQQKFGTAENSNAQNRPTLVIKYEAP